MGYLFVVERAPQVRDIVARGLAERGQWIAVGPGAAAALDRLALAYQTADDFCPSPELTSHCTRWRRETKELCDFVDQIVLAARSDLRRSGVAPGLFNLRALAVLFEGLKARSLILQRIVETFRRDTLIVHQRELSPPGDAAHVFAPADLLWGALATLPESAVRHEALPDPALAPTSGPARLQLAAHRLSAGAPRLADGLRALARLPLRRLNGSTRGKSLLVMGEQGEWDHTEMLFEEHGWELLRRSEAAFQAPQPPRLVLEVEHALGRAELTPHWQAGNVSLEALLWPRAAALFARTIAEAPLCEHRLRALRRHHGVEAVLAGGAHTATAHTVLQTARALGMRSFVWQSEFVADTGTATELRDYADCLGADVTFVLGPGVERVYRAQGCRVGNEVMTVGSARLDALRKLELPRPDALPVVLFVPTPARQNTWYLAYPPPPNDVELSRDQAHILRGLAALAAAGQCEAMVYLGDELGAFPGWPSGWERPGITRAPAGTPISALLAGTHVVVADRPDMPVLAALAANRRVCVLTRHLTLPHDAAALLAQSTACAATADGLLVRVAEALAGIRPAQGWHSRFLREFGTRDDADAARQVVRLVSAALASEIRVEDPTPLPAAR